MAGIAAGARRRATTLLCGPTLQTALRDASGFGASTSYAPCAAEAGAPHCPAPWASPPWDAHHRQSHAERTGARALSRGFFSVPDPSAMFKSAGGKSNLQTHRERRVVQVPPDLFFEVVADVNNYKKFLPFCVHSKVLRRPEESLMIAEMGIGFRVFQEHYTSRVALDKKSRKILITAVESPTFTTLTSSWAFKEVPGKKDHTEVDFKVEFGVINPLMSHAIDVVFNDVTRQQVKAFEAQCKKVLKERAAADKASAPSQDAPSTVSQAEVQQDDPKLSEEPPRSAAAGRGWESSSMELEEEVACVVAALSESAPLFRNGFPDVAALLEDRSECLSAASMRLAKHTPELSCSRGFALLAAEEGLRTAVADGLSGLVLPESFLGKKATHERAKGRTRVEVLARALHLLLTERCERQRASLLFAMADLNSSGRINQTELEGMLHSHVQIVGAAVPWLVHQTHRYAQEDEAHSLEERAKAAAHLLVQEIEAEVPAAVELIFSEADKDHDKDIDCSEWEIAWRSHPELMDLLSLEGMNRMVYWATAAPPMMPATDS